MRRFLFSTLLLIFTQGVFAQEEIPPLVGPVVYGQPISGHILFQDLGSGEVWELDGEALVENGDVLSWSSSGCYALYGRWNSQQYGLIDIQKHTIQALNLPLIGDEGDLSITGYPRWSPDGTRLAYGVFDGANTHFTAYDVVTGETEILYIREDFESSSGAAIINWSSENTLVYVREEYFEIDVVNGEIEYLLPNEFIGIPVTPPFSYTLRSPNREAIAVYFNLAEENGLLDSRVSYNNRAEIEAMDQVIVERPGIEIYVVGTGETFSFDLGGQIVSAAAWSPDGRRLAILAWPGGDYETAHGAYIYELATNTISPVDDLHPVRHTDPGEYGYFRPGWSANGEWVTLFGLDVGWVAYNLGDESITPLAEAFQETISMMSVSFSSVTGYEPDACI